MQKGCDNALRAALRAALRELFFHSCLLFSSKLFELVRVALIFVVVIPVGLSSASRPLPAARQAELGGHRGPFSFAPVLVGPRSGEGGADGERARELRTYSILL